MYSSEPIKNTDTVFLGDSLTESFDLIKHFGLIGLKNRGVSGDMTEHVIYRLEEITNAKPVSIFLMIGINDIYQGMGIKKTIKNINGIIDHILSKSSSSKLYVQSILPVNEKNLLGAQTLNTLIYKANAELKNICKSKNITYIDLFTDFLDNTGQMQIVFTYDGVHLSEAGYILWASLIQDFLK